MRSPTDATNLRDSHPFLYRSILFHALVSVALGFNFWLTKPTFNPYGIDYRIIGSVFILLGLAKLTFLHGVRAPWGRILVRRSIRGVRVVVALKIAWVTFWAIGTTVTFFQGKTSLQLFILYAGLALLEASAMYEPFRNPLTARPEPRGAA